MTHHTHHMSLTFLLPLILDDSAAMDFMQKVELRPRYKIGNESKGIHTTHSFLASLSN